MSTNLLKLQFINICTSEISFHITPNLSELTKKEIDFSLNDTITTNFDLIVENSSPTIYKIIPYTPFNYYDYFTIQILKNDGTSSDKTKVYLSKIFSNNIPTDISFKVSEKSSGEYILNLYSVNNVPLNITSSPITLCRDLNINECNVSLNGGTSYNVGEEIKIDLVLKTIDDESVPNGLYCIKINTK